MWWNFQDESRNMKFILPKWGTWLMFIGFHVSCFLFQHFLSSVGCLCLCTNAVCNFYARTLIHFFCSIASGLWANWFLNLNFRSHLKWKENPRSKTCLRSWKLVVSFTNYGLSNLKTYLPALPQNLTLSQLYHHILRSWNSASDLIFDITFFSFLNNDCFRFLILCLFS